MLALGLLLGIGLSPRADDKPRLNFEPARKVTLDVGYADCRNHPAPDGQFYQMEQEHSNRYKAGCGTAGFSIALNDDWTVGAHYVYLGRVETHALAVNFPGDERSNMTPDIDPMRAECASSLKEGCLAQWHTGSFTRGVNFSVARKLFNIGDVRFDGKAGLYFHRLSNHAVVEPIGECRDSCPWRVTLDQSGQRIKPMWGAIVSWKYLYLGWEFYEGIGEHTPVSANIKGRTEVKTVGLRIPLL